MDKYHVNDKGEAGRCWSTTANGCPFGGESDHYDSPEEARNSFEEKMNYLTFTQISLPRSQKIREALVEDEMTDEQTLKTLADDPSSIVRRKLARRPDISTELVDKLSRDPDASVRTEIGMNRNLSVEARLRLLQDPDENVQYYSLKVYPLPEEMIEPASKSSNDRVRLTIAWDSNAPDEILKALSDDPDASVASAARNSLAAKWAADIR